mgnify:CR=1 FL=1
MPRTKVMPERPFEAEDPKRRAERVEGRMREAAMVERYENKGTIGLRSGWGRAGVVEISIGQLDERKEREE